MFEFIFIISIINNVKNAFKKNVQLKQVINILNGMFGRFSHFFFGEFDLVLRSSAIFFDHPTSNKLLKKISKIHTTLRLKHGNIYKQFDKFFSLQLQSTNMEFQKKWIIFIVVAF